MSPNRKAELQRKLAMAPVPKPPAGLAERIKDDIPHPLRFDVVQERRRFSQSVAFNMRVAASILLLISSLYVVLHLMSRAERSETMATAVAPRQAAAPAPQPQVASTPATAQSAPKPVEIAETKTQPAADENRPVTQIAEAKPAPKFERRREELPRPAPPPPPPTTAAIAPQEGVAGGAVGGVVPGSARAAAKVQAAPAPAAAAAPAPPTLVGVANAADLTLEPKTLFGVATKKSDAPPRKMSIDVASEVKDGKSLLRITIDAPDASPAAADAKIDVDWRVPHEAVTGFSDAKENAIPARASVTAVYTLDLPPNLGRRDVIAKVTLRYHSVVDGSEKTVVRTIRRRDVAAPDHQ